MKRKAIQLAKNTLVVSLPSSWVKRYGVKKGAELELEEIGAMLSVALTAQDDIKKVILDASHLSERPLRWAISGLHKQGFDQVEVRYESPKTADILHDLLRDTLLGFTVVSQRERVMILRQVTRDADDQFDPVLRRAFLVTISLAEGVADAERRGDYDELKDLTILERTNNQLTNFCLRLISKGKAGILHPHLYYTILWNLEKVADEYKYLVTALPKKHTLDKHSITLLQDTAQLVRLYYELFFSSGTQLLNEFALRKTQVDEAAKKRLSGNAQQVLVAHHVCGIMTRLGDLASACMAMRSSDGAHDKS